MVNERKTRCCPLLILLLLGLSLLALTLPQEAEAAGQRDVCVIDEDGVLSDAEAAQLETQFKAIEDAHDVRIIAATVKDWRGKPLEPLARNILSSDLGAGGGNGAIVLLFVPEDKAYYVATDAKMRTRINDEGIEHLTEKFLPTLKDNLYADAFQLFSATTGEMLAYYEREKKPFTPPPSVLGAGTRTATDSTRTKTQSGALWRICRRCAAKKMR